MNVHRGICLLLAAWLLPRAHAAPMDTEECLLSSPWLPAISAQCATVTVAENPQAPDGRRIELFVARVPSLNAAPRPDPLVLIAGGPGQGASDFFLGMRGAFAHVRRDRDILIVDQRGTGRSNSLRCELDEAGIETADPARLPQLMTECLDRLDGDPRFYTTSVAVSDLNAVREAFALEQWNLYGVSYGTRVALHYLRRFPTRSRAVILDGVVPPELALGPAIAANAQHTLEQAFARCGEDPDCAARFPDPGSRLQALETRLRNGPVSVQLPDPRTGAVVERPLSLLHLRSVVRLMSYSPRTLALLPLLIAEAYAGNYGPLTAQAHMLIGELETSLSVPMHNSVVCTEDVPFFSREETEGLSATYLGTSIVDALAAVCSVWPRGRMDEDFKEPVVSERPVLLLSGEADPVTPPDYGFQVLSSLSSARHLVGPGQGHGQAGVGCVPRLLRLFLEEPDPGALNAECLQQERSSPFFLDFNGPAP